MPGTADAGGDDTDGRSAMMPDTAGAGVEDSGPAAAILMDDFEGGGKLRGQWMLNSSPGASLTFPAPEPSRASSRQAMHVVPAPMAMGVDVFTHEHFDWTTFFAGLRFWVRFDSPAVAELAVAVTPGVPETHDAALAAGRPWLVARLSAGPEWAQVTVRFDTLRPEGPGIPQATQAGNFPGVSVLHFLTLDDHPSGFWLDDVELLCTQAGCGS